MDAKVDAKLDADVVEEDAKLDGDVEVDEDVGEEIERDVEDDVGVDASKVFGSGSRVVAVVVGSHAAETALSGSKSRLPAQNVPCELASASATGAAKRSNRLA